MVAALFAVHPINVESVVWIAERKTVLSMTFFLLALGAYTWYAAKPKAGRYVVVAVLFALGLMAKPQVITFPCVLLLWDYWPLGTFAFRQKGSGLDSGEQRIAKSESRTFGSLLQEKLPLFAIAAAGAALTMKAQRAGGSVLSLGDFPVTLRVGNAVVAYVRYLGKTFWPLNLAPMYPHPGASLRAWQVYGALALLLAITMFVIDKRRHGYLLVGWLWFLGTLVPMIGLVQVGRQAMADRYAYLPLLGIFVMLCWGVADFAGAKRLPAMLLPVAGVVIVVLLGAVARHQINYWADNQVLWTHTIEVTPPNYVAEDNLGGTLLKRNRTEDAIAHFRRAAAIHPVDPISAFNIAFYDQQHGDLIGAVEGYKRSIILTTSTGLKIKAYENMGIAYRDLGDSEQARQSFDEAKRLQGP
jgi:tetratricopeptide (TPR) repeat protein